MGTDPINKPMAQETSLLPLLSLFTSLFTIAFSLPTMYPFPCSQKITACNSSLYHVNNGLPEQDIASFYAVNQSQIKPITRLNTKDYLISVPCSCLDVNGTTAYFYNVSYLVKQNDNFSSVSTEIYNGQAWQVGGEEKSFVTGKEVSIYLLCGCLENADQVVLTYTVQQHDTLLDIANLLSAQVSGIERMNQALTNPGFIDVGWVFYVPTEKNGIKAPKPGRRHKWALMVFILASVTFLSIGTLLVFLVRGKRSKSKSKLKDPKGASKNLSGKRAFSVQSQYFTRENLEDMTALESERPVIFSLEEIEEATSNFDESRKIGEGGYGSVYYGVLGEQEVAIKKMRSNKSKEFFAELRVLCKIHHINVVELLGYASGDDHLYLVYEFIPSGALSEHLHDPLLKGHQPLSWSARAQIALAAARGIEYIHDHTKARYVHRDIKTANILLADGLKAKVADFGLAKLVGRTNEDEFIATRLVGTPGYLPPESVKELQVTTKTDVFAFGVVLAELITGQRALMRDNREPNKLKSLITVVHKIFNDEHPEMALEAVIDGNLKGSYPMEDVYKMAEIAEWCLSEDPVSRPEIGEIISPLSDIAVSSVEWEASLGGNSQVFSGLLNGR